MGDTDVHCLCSPNAGWIAVPVAEDMLQKLSKLFVVTQPRELGTGRDAATYPRPYNNLKPWCAWRIEHQLLWDKYVVERNDVIRHLRQLEHNDVKLDTWQSKLEDSTPGMPECTDRREVFAPWNKARSAP
eukprot:Skav236045  [mRNA]  locus=scaffold2302:40907:41834:+ [translate_table: standard]